MPRTREAGLIVALLLVGAALRAWEYFGSASLWINEIAVARNVLDRSALDLVSRPLDYDQSAPPAYLLATKLATILLGGGELAFRLPPFLAGLTALALFPLVARRFLEPRGALVATALAALATRPKPNSTVSMCSVRSSSSSPPCAGASSRRPRTSGSRRSPGSPSSGSRTQP
jgi:hypothetical protein